VRSGFGLELKIPPLLLALLFAFMMWLLAHVSAGFVLPKNVAGMASAVLAVSGLLSIAVAALSFRKAGTTVNPVAPETSSALVSNRVYRFTRNPMYLGMLLLLLAWGIYLANALSIALCVGFILYMNRFQIEPEERALTIIFGDAYRAYLDKVRRWL